MNLSIVIPCYNEAQSIPLIIETCKKTIHNDAEVEYILVNNGSADNTKEVLDNLLSGDQKIFKVVHVSKNQGYGYGILQGLAHASGEALAWTHADLQTDPADVIKAFEKYKIVIEENKGIVKGGRINRNPIDQFFTFGMSVITQIYLKQWLSDINAQPKIFSRTFYNEWASKAPYDFSLDLFLLYTANKGKLDIHVFPVHFLKRKYGVAKGGGTFKGKIKLIKRTLAYIKTLASNIK